MVSFLRKSPFPPACQGLYEGDLSCHTSWSGSSQREVEEVPTWGYGGEEGGGEQHGDAGVRRALYVRVTGGGMARGQE